MSYDPMCPMHGSDKSFAGEIYLCRCDLIARVVERERERAANDAEARYYQGWRDGITETLIAVRARGGER